MKKLYFLGPKGTYSELAAKKNAPYLNEVDLVAISTIQKIVELAQNEDNYAILPIENLIEGIVRPTIDSLLNSDLKIQAHFEVEINHCLFSKSEKKENIKNIISHPQALAQCSKYILENFDENINLIATTSTSAGAIELLDKDESYGAICACEVGDNLSLNLIDKNIGDNKGNKTRFVLLSKSDLSLGKKNRTSLVFNTKNEAGALFKVLEIFNKYNLNMVYIESRPSKRVIGEYNFFVDIDKGLDDNAPVINEIKALCNFCKILGSYPNV